MEKTVKMANPRLYMRTRPYMSPKRPKVNTSTEVTSRNPMRTHRKYELLPGARGSSLIPRKMSGKAMMVIEPLITTMSTPIVVLVSATHL